MPRNSSELNNVPSGPNVYTLPEDTERESYRLSTYVKFPTEAPVDACILANHGFTYTGYKDRVKCFSCGANKQDWRAQDNPGSKEWHNRGCELVLGTDTNNKPILSSRPTFVGTFASPPRFGNGRISTISSSSSDEVEELMNGRATSHSLPALINQLDGPGLPPTAPTGPQSMAIDSSRPRNTPLVKVNPTSIRPRIAQASSTSTLPRAYPTPEHRRLAQLLSCLNPKHPEMRDFFGRRMTFRKSAFPQHQLTASSDQMAEAGFFYLGRGDRTKCWYCGGGLQNWKKDDDPFEEHAKWYPNCEFILRCKGVRYVQDIVAKHPNLVRPNITNSRFDVRSSQMIDAPSLRSPRMTDVGHAARLSLQTLRDSDASTSGSQTSSSGSDHSRAPRRTNARQRGTVQRTCINKNPSPVPNTGDAMNGETDNSSCYTAASTSTGSSLYSQISDTESSSNAGSTPFPSMNNPRDSRFEKRSGRSQQGSNLSELEAMGFERTKIQDAIMKKGSQASLEQLVNHLLSEDVPFTTPDLRSESATPADPPPAYSFVPSSLPNPTQLVPMDLSQLRSQHLTLPQFGEQPMVVLCNTPFSSKDEDPKCDVLVIRNASEETAREGIKRFFQNSPPKKK